MKSFTNASGPGSVRIGQLPGSIGVLEALDKGMPIGIAFRVDRTEGGLAVWRLNVHDADVPGQWVINRRFVPVDHAPG
jgi:hypothetical protein